MPQFLRQQLAGAAEGSSDGSNRAIHPRRDFLVTQPFDIFQQNHQARLRLQAEQGFMQVRLHFLLQDALVFTRAKRLAIVSQFFVAIPFDPVMVQTAVD